MDPNLHDLWAGLSNLTLVPERFELGEGVVISQTYAHFMAPFLMAFTPATPGRHHPAPWKAAKGGLGFDIAAELFVSASCSVKDLDRLNLMWWIVALLRLKATPVVFAPIISSEKLSSIPIIQQEPELWPMEIHTHRLMPEPAPVHRVDVPELEWVRMHWQEGSALLANEDFNFAFQAVDQSIWGANPCLALVGLWGALERIFSPSNQELSFRVSAYIAAYLEAPGKNRFKCFKHVKSLYDRRSKAAHGESKMEAIPYEETYAVARRALLKMIETRRVPKKSHLEAGVFGDDIQLTEEDSTIQ